MKKHWGLILGIVLPVVIAGPSYAATETVLNFTFTVKTVFTLSISSSEMDFGAVTPDSKTTLSRPLTITPVSNTGRPWILQITGPTDFINTRDSTLTFDIGSLRWTGTSSSSRVPGTFITDRQSVSKQASLIYSSPVQGSSSASNINTDTNGTAINLVFDVTVPNKTIAGPYETVILFTFTEG